MDEDVFVLDTSAFITGYEPADGSVKNYTVPKVIDELADQMIKIRVLAAVDSGRLHIIEPEEEFKNKILETAETTGDSTTLSQTDVSVLSLALQLKMSAKNPVVVTDDFAIQNLANYLKIKHKSLTTRGISRSIRWQTYCPACHRNFKNIVQSKVCPVCGTKLSRKPILKSTIVR